MLRNCRLRLTVMLFKLLNDELDTRRWFPTGVSVSIRKKLVNNVDSAVGLPAISTSTAEDVINLKFHYGEFLLYLQPTLCFHSQSSLRGLEVDGPMGSDSPYQLVSVPQIHYYRLRTVRSSVPWIGCASLSFTTTSSRRFLSAEYIISKSRSVYSRS